MASSRDVSFEFESGAGIEYECRATVNPGYPGCGPSYSHGGLPPDPPEVDGLQVRELREDGGESVWGDPEDDDRISADDLDRIEEKAFEVASDAEEEERLPWEP